ncbi:MAG TPA: hypothetical protein VMS17_07510 [Gemmataceae bacterium]|nr:hypothetical protein [Gemmataceae bacterium]
MIRFGRFAAGLIVCLGLFAALTVAEPPRDHTPPWADSLLEQVKLAPANAQLDPKRWTDGGPYRLNTFQRCWDDWRQIDPTARAAGKDFLAAADSFEGLIATAAPLIDVKPLPAAAVPQPEELKEPPADAALSQAVIELQAALDKPLTPEQKKDLAARIKAVPPAVARAAAVLLEAMPGALKKRNQALAKIGGPDKLQAAYDRARGLALDYTVDADTLKLLRDVDLTALVQGGQELAQAMDRAAALLAKPPNDRFEFAWDTPIGAISLNGAQDNVYGAGPYLLIIDTGGNDRYASGGATTSAANPISLLLDLAGDDVYEAKDGPAFGAGILGYGFLLDFAGDDVYKADRLACGMASFGVGMLLDRSGKDKYEIDRLGQGAAFFGVGVLSDLKGDDEYHCFQEAQGFGGTMGCGVLVDREGNDLYMADDTKIRYPSPQDMKHNTSLAQGCSFGRRDHPGAGNSLAGGVGILIDGKGDDHYQCGVFGQGVSYWYGLGMLIDLEGDDSYEGVWYCQGSAAHYGVGALCDMAGDDTYVTKLTMGQGAAHDYSIAWLHDATGNDTYECPGNCMGFALYNGIGIFWDEAGDDAYKTVGAAFGATGETRPESLCLGLFIDEGGKNDFPKDSRAKPRSTWTQPPNKDQPLSYGAGIAR